MTQMELGERLGITYQQIHKYESGEIRVPASKLSALADAQQVPISYYFQGVNVRGAHGDNDNVIDLSFVANTGTCHH